ncbi:thiamine-monophosphate kinase [Sulfolobus acidocaldarius SUSAZ]|nr:thiamine-monophosphate kinase [Sulfolobus acidocaldarius SUSAZ]
MSDNVTNDDVYVEGKNMYKIDGFQLSYEFNFLESYDIGWRSVIGVISDILSKGGLPKFFLASLGLNKNRLKEIENILKGISDAVNYYKGSYVGGDTNSSDNSGWIDIVGIGEALCYKSVDNIKRGDKVIITSPIGYNSIIFISYVNNWKISIPLKYKLKYKHPIVNPHLQDIFSQNCDSIHYSLDISDGLIVSLYNLVERSKLGIEITKMPVSEDVLNIANNYKIKLLDLLKFSGEEYESIFVVDKDFYQKIINQMKLLGLNPVVFGEISDRQGVYFNGELIRKTGWDNFLGWF